MGESRRGVELGETGEGAGLVGVEDAVGSGDEGEAGSGYPLHDFGDGL